MLTGIHAEEREWEKKYEEHFGIPWEFDFRDDKPRNAEEAIE